MNKNAEGQKKLLINNLTYFPRKVYGKAGGIIL